MKFIRANDRKSIRLKEYDYSRPGEYFVTICTYNRECFLGDIINKEMRLSVAGEVVKEEWLRTKAIRSNVELYAFVVMSNHGIIILNETNDKHGRGTSQCAPTVERFGKSTSNSIPTIIRLFKSTTTKQINKIRHSPGFPLWQRGYYEHIIRNEKDLNNIRDYIVNNPIKWFYDDENPNRRDAILCRDTANQTNGG
jgi:putative transposase